MDGDVAKVVEVEEAQHIDVVAGVLASQACTRSRSLHVNQPISTLVCLIQLINYCSYTIAFNSEPIRKKDLLKLHLLCFNVSCIELSKNSMLFLL